jgi:hypothetical protein
MLLATVAAFLLVPSVAAASPTITFSSGPGTGSPPSTLGPYAMQAFAPSGSTSGAVSAFPGPTGQLTVNPQMNFISQSFAAGTSGFLFSYSTTETLTLPANTGAFYLYAGSACPGCSSPPGAVTITAAAQDGTSSGALIVGTSPEYYGFYATCGSTLQTVSLSITGSFPTIGAFGIAPASAATPCGSTTSSTPKTFPCSTSLIGGSCTVGETQIAGGSNPVAAYVPQGTAEYEQLLKLGVIPVSGECLQNCVITIEALLKEGKLATGSSASASGAKVSGRLLTLGKVQMKITHGAATASLRISPSGRKLLKKEKAKRFKIELRLSAKTPSGKRLGSTKVVDLSVARGKT